MSVHKKKEKSNTIVPLFVISQVIVLRVSSKLTRKYVITIESLVQ